MVCILLYHMLQCGWFPFPWVSWAIGWLETKSSALQIHENFGRQSVRIRNFDKSWSFINRKSFKASVGPSIFIVAASYAGCNRTIVIILFTIAMGTMGGFYPGEFNSNVTLKMLTNLFCFQEWKLILWTYLQTMQDLWWLQLMELEQ